MVEGRDSRLKSLPLIVIEGKLEIVMYASAIEFRQIRNKGSGVLRPKDDDLDPFEGDPHRPLIERVVPHGVPLPQTVDEPFGVKSRYVRRAAHGEDDGGGGGDIGVFHDVIIVLFGIVLVVFRFYFFPKIPLILSVKKPFSA